MSTDIKTHLANDLEQSAAMLDSREFDAVQLDNCASMMRYAATVIRQALADAALDKMADNARELGLTYDASVAQIDTSPERVEKEVVNKHIEARVKGGGV
jgi:3-oxoacyl-(acyl-carrier-protein) synthase